MTDATIHYFGYILAIGLTFLCSVFCLGCAFACRCIAKAWRSDIDTEALQHANRQAQMRAVNTENKVVPMRRSADPINDPHNDFEGEGPAPIPTLDSHAPGA